MDKPATTAKYTILNGANIKTKTVGSTPISLSARLDESISTANSKRDTHFVTEPEINAADAARAACSRNANGPPRP